MCFVFVHDDCAIPKVLRRVGVLAYPIWLGGAPSPPLGVGDALPPALSVRSMVGRGVEATSLILPLS